MFVVYAHNLQVRGHETSNRTNTDRKKVGCHSSVHSEQLLLIGAQEATSKPGLLRSRWVCKVPEARNSCLLLKAGRSSWGCMSGNCFFYHVEIGTGLKNKEETVWVSSDNTEWAQRWLEIESPLWHWLAKGGVSLGCNDMRQIVHRNFKNKNSWKLVCILLSPALSILNNVSDTYTLRRSFVLSFKWLRG